MEYDYEVRLLSTDFTAKYPAAQYPEIMVKHERPYTCLLIESKDGYLICVPFRSNITHGNAYMFRNSARSRQSHSGLDYSKIVLLTDFTFLDTVPAIVDQDEYNEMAQNLGTIVTEVSAYIDSYIAHLNGSAPLHPREFSRRYQFSTLSYFHNILGLTN